MGYNPFDFIGTDKRKRVSPKVMGLAHDVVTEHKLKEVIKKTIIDIQNVRQKLQLKGL